MNDLVWAKYLFSEGVENNYSLPANFRDYLNGDYDKWRDKFQELFEKNSFFLTQLVNDIIKEEIAPRFKSLAPDVQRQLYSILTHPKLHKMGVWDKYTYIERKFTGIRLLKYMEVEQLSLLLLYYFSPEKRDIALSSIRQNEFPFMDFYKVLYSNKTPPVIRILKKTSTNALPQNIKIIIKRFNQVEPSDLSKSPVLRQVTIGKIIGAGAYGTVYDLVGQDRVMKIFEDGVDLERDTDRMEDVIEQVYGGTASLEDMHYFEQGQLGESGLYYAIMPKIIPYSSFFTEKKFGTRGRRYFMDLAACNKRTVWNVTSVLGRDTISFPEFRGRVFHEMKGYGHSQSEIRKYYDTSNAIIRAGYNAFSKWHGTDLHGGNLGFIAQKPEVFFYYDM